MGDDIFGGVRMREATNKSVGEALEYVSKFTTDVNGTCVTDRLYNVESIAAVSMGCDAVDDDMQGDAGLARHVRVGRALPLL